MSYRPTPDIKHPLKLPTGETWPHTVYLKNVISHPRILVGDYSYYNDFTNPKDYARKLAPYLHPASREKLVIGKYVQIAHGVQFITSSANHQMNGASAYPFTIFGGAWTEAYKPEFPFKGDNVVGHDVWIGHEAMIMPGVSIGSGAIIGARAVVTKDVPAYAIVAGNPARVIKLRFADTVIESLLKLAWWDWKPDEIDANIKHIVGGDIDKLIEVAKTLGKLE